MYHLAQLWQETFAVYYNKPVSEQGQFGQAILDNNNNWLWYENHVWYVTFEIVGNIIVKGTGDNAVLFVIFRVVLTTI